MIFEVLTLFPDMVRGPMHQSITGRALDAGVIALHVTDIREHATNRHRNVDDTPYGGGAGMVMTPQPLSDAIGASRERHPAARVILLSPSGRRFDQAVARELAGSGVPLVLVCGRYEGVDERVAEHFCDDELSIGDYVLSGGELAALVVMDAVTRLIPGALGNAASPVEESLSDGLLEYPQYTRPQTFHGHDVPPVLLSGNHAEIARWRRRESLLRTRARRPDLWSDHPLSVDDKKLLEP